MSAEYVRRQYGVNYRRGDRVRVDGRRGVIVSFPEQYIGVRFDGEDGTTKCHPTWHVQTLTKHLPPFVIHVDDMQKFADALYIGRANPRRRLPKSKYANPFTVAKFGLAGSLYRYEGHLHNVMIDDGDGTLASAKEQMRRLSGRPLACWCRHHGEEETDSNRCHGDLIVAMWHRLLDDDDQVNR